MKTNREKFFARHGIDPKDSLSLEQIAKLSKMPIAALRAVERRGFGAYNTNLQSVRLKGSFKKGVDAPASMKLSPQQWAISRVYSFVMKQPGTYGGADKDIREQYGL